MPVVTQWTGRETLALRKAMRLPIVDFAARLQISDRMVVKWESGGEAVVPRMVNQAGLDTLLEQASPEVTARFVALLAPEDASVPRQVVVEADEFTETQIGEYVRHPRDGKMMAKVPGGIFLAGQDSEPNWVDAFWIDAHPVTNADWARYCAATGTTPPRHWPDGRCPRELYDHPVVWVTHEQATAYARWAHKALPSTLQWEKAARGTSGSIWPWGDQRTTAKCNVKETCIGATTPVSTYHSGISEYGVYDMIGNVWEWCADETTKGRYELKGGAWTTPFFRGEPSMYNDADGIVMADDDTGFRCVATPESMPRNRS
ncbi:SUMF1/EgtB/PvdO family nonheme iron enzyme [Streptomyces lunalinharesii]|uniref:Sulfatase-modifying factor enzyme-like domain-containing protein n=1 Tax=Streptomyces lunalinharesii TaxID=333384 RepID=A0ABP6FCR7_9ACTN